MFVLQKGGAIVARFTIREIYNGKKYDVLNAAMEEFINKGRPSEIGERTWLDMLLVKHTLIVAEIMKEKGDSVSIMFNDEPSAFYVRWNGNDDA